LATYIILGKYGFWMKVGRLLLLSIPPATLLASQQTTVQQNRYSRGNDNVTSRTGTLEEMIMLPGEQVFHRK